MASQVGRLNRILLSIILLTSAWGAFAQTPTLPPIYVGAFSGSTNGFGGSVAIHWGEMWVAGNLTSLPSETNLGHLDEKASGSVAFDKWARYRASGQLAGHGFALSYLGGTGSWASRWSSIIPSSFNAGNSPLLYAGLGTTTTLADANQPGWFPTKPQIDPPIMPLNPQAFHQQPLPDITDGRMTNAFFQNYPLPFSNSLIHSNDTFTDHARYYYLKNAAIHSSSYYISTESGFVLNQSGTPVNLVTEAGNDREFRLYFVDTLDRMPPEPSGSNLGIISLSSNASGLKGFFYIMGNVELSGTGNTGYSPYVEKPDGSRDLSTKESQDLGKVFLNGVLGTAGWVSVAGNPIIYGAVIAEKGITGSGSMDVYYDASLSHGRRLEVEVLSPTPTPSFTPSPTPMLTPSLTPTPGPTVFPDPDPSSIDGFPRRLSALGDVTGDGKSDFAVSANGRVYVFSSVSGEFIRIFSPVEPETSFGSALVGIGNLNGNNRDELIIGAPNQTVSTLPSSSGRVFVVDAATGSQIRALSSPNPIASGGFGTSVAALPDVNGDAAPDFIIGAPRDRVGFSFDSAGAAYVFSGATGSVIRTVVSPSEKTAGYFGSLVIAIHDLDADGLDDYAALAAGEGKLHLFSSSTGALVRSLPLGTTSEIIASVSDLNNDTVPDFLIGDPSRSITGFERAGAVWVMSGVDGGELWRRFSPNPTISGSFGSAVAYVDDFNADGVPDWLVGAPNESPEGRAYLISGDSGSAIRTFHGQTHPRLGGQVIQIDDIEGDGLPEIVIADWQSVKMFLSSRPTIVGVQVSEYLLGLSSDPGGLDLDDDGSIDVGDLITTHLQ